MSGFAQQGPGEGEEKGEWVRGIFEVLPLPVVLVELGSAKVLFANRAAVEMAGGHFPLGVEAGEYDEAFYCTGADGNRISGSNLPGARVARGERFSDECLDWHLEGRSHSLLVSGGPLPAAGGLLGLGFLAFQDATALKRAEQAQREIAEELLARSRELERSNEDLQQFAYVASHDLQEPLRTVASYAQLLERSYADRLDEQGREFLGFIVDGARRMGRLIQDLLAYSRVVNTASTRQFGSVETSVAADMAADNLTATILETGAKVTRDPLPAVWGDPAQFVQLFQNLLANAIQYRSDSPPRIHISSEARDKCWVFTVADNGIGIEPQYAERIFMPFKRLHGKDRPGSGVGLAIARKILERHGGRIWVESRPGEGSRFRFTVPQ
jgi:signal transduction histidine kinase